MSDSIFKSLPAHLRFQCECGEWCRRRAQRLKNGQTELYYLCLNCGIIDVRTMRPLRPISIHDLDGPGHFGWGREQAPEFSVERSATDAD